MSAKKGRVTVDRVTKIFARSDTNTTTTALDDVSLEVAPGEFVCLVGSSGCGKSTLLRLIAGLLNPTRGALYLDGEEIRGTSPSRGMAFQDPTLFPWRTVWENAAFGPRMQGGYASKKEDVARLIELAGLEEFRNSYPHQLSGGMAQRLALIRTMVNEPDVFLLDEPLGALDAFTRMNMQAEIVNMWRQRGNTMILITHDVEEAVYLGNRVVVMSPRPGRIRKTVEIDLAYPRNRNNSKFLAYRSEILEMLGLATSDETADAEVFS